MAIEIITDADSGTSTVGDTAVNLAGNYNATLLGATFEWCAGFFGAYAAYTRIVTGVTIDIQAPVSINIFGGFKLVIQGGGVYTVGKLTEMKIHDDVLHKFTKLTKKIDHLLELKIDDRRQTIVRGVNIIYDLTESGTTRTTNYDVETATGNNYRVACQDSICFSVGESSSSAVIMDPDATSISGKLVSINGDVTWIA